MPLVFPTGASSHPKNTLQKGKFEIKVVLLLHILIPGAMLSSSLDTINPWLSACDLKQQELKGSCSATTQFPTSATPLPEAEICPKECSPNESKTNASCLAYLDETRRNAICNFNLGNGIEWLKSFLGTIRLRHCCEYKIIESLSSSLLERVLRGKDECFRIIDSLVEVDNLASRITCEFSEVLSRYDCGQPYSVKFSCNDCLEAYRRWVCSTLVPYYNESVRVRPCRSVCQAVEQKCPYFLPENKAPALPTQYAGEPTFLCMDPNIPETGEQQKKSLYPDDSTCCVRICGSLKGGLCVKKGSKCKSEELIPYEDALDQTVECIASETTGTRVPSLECTASEPYSSPHKLGSGGPRQQGPWPTLILFSAGINQTARGLPCSLLFLLILLHCSIPPLALLNLLACLCPVVVVGDLARTGLSLARVKRQTKLFFHFVKRISSFCNYLKFESNKWQYFFILISVNLAPGPVYSNPQPLKTPSCFANGKHTRRARRYYYCSYYKCRGKTNTNSKILSRIAQMSKFDPYGKKFRGTKRGLVVPNNKQIPRYKKLASMKPNDSLTINRIKERSSTYNITTIARGYSEDGAATVEVSRGRTDGTRAGADPGTFFVKKCTDPKCVLSRVTFS